MENTVTKSDLINHISKNTGINYSESSKIIELFFDIVSDAITQNTELKITGLGTFYTKDKKERVGRNPKTKEEFNIKSHKVVSFKAAQTLRDILN